MLAEYRQLASAPSIFRAGSFGRYRCLRSTFEKAPNCLVYLFGRVVAWAGTEMFEVVLSEGSELVGVPLRPCCSPGRYRCLRSPCQKVPNWLVYLFGRVVARSGRKVDGKDPLTLKSLMLFLKMAVDILGLDTNLLNKSSSGCQLFRKLIYNYILTTIAQNILSAMDAALDGIKSSKKFKQDPFCLLAYLETHSTKDPWKIFRSKKSALYTYINRMRPRDVPFANWIRDMEKLMIELGQVPLPERKLDGTFETDASCPSGERGKVVYYDITTSPPIITEIYMTLKDNCGSETLAVELDRDITDRTLSWQALRTIFAKYFTSIFPDQGRKGNKEGSRVETEDGEEEGVEDTEVAEEGMDRAAAGTEEEGTGASAAIPASTPLPLPTVEEET
uniref:Uncharacterized protein n=1 Tax=Chromera velia CCMP2878 TaxID=1169474 RepID=A0A0G4I3W3_9ALVE|eukprot:Cvel_10782.t1-p1 / transcript=Cvel_10782.t1 / gene=Cvel_10782 / organism=Chromera_velia_CCMP2878 / gene_product=hypothetical protein / transcript_product=hypothetical protein / location=Cvel_scaffold658:63926-74576(-) / protein_length=389 / sequence_SO=supercontig / SO=protein_coding / is_pseudo=false